MLVLNSTQWSCELCEVQYYHPATTIADILHIYIQFINHTMRWILFYFSFIYGSYSLWSLHFILQFSFLTIDRDEKHVIEIGTKWRKSWTEKVFKFYFGVWVIIQTSVSSSLLDWSKCKAYHWDLFRMTNISRRLFFRSLFCKGERRLLQKFHNFFGQIGLSSPL